MVKENHRKIAESKPQRERAKKLFALSFELFVKTESNGKLNFGNI